jgi:subtilisin family serine protease
VTVNSATIEVANMSLSAEARVTGPCGVPARGNRIDHIHNAVCAATAAGVTLVASAGNDTRDATGYLPAAYPEVITVSALADSDGQAGGLGPPPPCLPDTPDDHFAFFSNFGSVVDIAAPGVCISSTYPGGLYATSSGTSFAAPLVAGAAALLRVRNPSWSPQTIRSHLLGTAETGPIPGDPDAFPEGVLDVSTY